MFEPLDMLQRDEEGLMDPSLDAFLRQGSVAVVHQRRHETFAAESLQLSITSWR